jgi:hypothetical protein
MVRFPGVKYNRTEPRTFINKAVNKRYSGDDKM